MKKNKIIVTTKSKVYPVFFGNNILNTTGNILKKNLPHVKKICIISDNKIPNIFLKILTKSLRNYKIKIYKLTANEKTKNFNLAYRIIQQLLKEDFNRSDCLIALGGGVIGDLTAFIANLTKRGLNFINIPTTLLAQVDASIGGKTGINSNLGKNLIGTFYQPNFIISDVNILKSLPQREIISGYAEILKHALIIDKKFFMWLFKNGKKIIINKDPILFKKAIIKSCKIKCNIVRKDETEKNLRMILNFGHTFAHGFEGAKKFSREINHGEAVLLGMMIASELANKKKLLSSKELALIQNHYINLNLPRSIKKIFKKSEINNVISYMKKDKKNVDEKISIILLNKIGQATKPKKYALSSVEIKKNFYSYY